MFGRSSPPQSGSPSSAPIAGPAIEIHPNVGSDSDLQRLLENEPPQNITSLTAEGVTVIPPSITNLRSLKELNLRCANLSDWPSALSNLRTLEKLTVHGAVEEIPESIAQLTSLTALDLSCANLRQLPSALGGMSKLKTLTLACCKKLNGWPDSVTKLDLDELSLHGCNRSFRGGLVSYDNWIFKFGYAFGADPRDGVWTLLTIVTWVLAAWSLEKVMPGKWELPAIYVPFGIALLFIIAACLISVRCRCCAMKKPEYFFRVLLSAKRQQRAAATTLLNEKSLQNVFTSIAFVAALFATATFLTFLPPPGHVDVAGQSIVVGDLELPPNRLHELKSFFVLASLSFVTSVTVVVLAVAASFPRLCRNKDYEAGRAYVLLILASGLLTLALVTGVAAFLASAFLILPNNLYSIIQTHASVSLYLTLAFITFWMQKALMLYPGHACVGTYLRSSRTYYW